MKRTEFATMLGCVRSFCAVLAEPCERDDVLTREMVECIAEAAAHELQRAFRQDA
jgi:hypothetical protein